MFACHSTDRLKALMLCFIVLCNDIKQLIVNTGRLSSDRWS